MTYVLCFIPLPLWACDNWQAKVVAIQGTVEQQNADGNWQSVEAEALVCPGQSIRVAANSRASLYLRNNSYLRLDQLSAITFPSKSAEDSFLMQIQEGLAHFISRIRQSMVVSTPNLNAEVEGTEFLVQADGNGSFVCVLEGQVATYNQFGRALLTSGQGAEAARGAAPKQIPVRPKDEVQWALYYPPVLTLNSLSRQAGAEYAQALNDAQALVYLRPDAALSRLDAVPDGQRPPSFPVAKASIYLAAGRFQEAQQQLNAAPVTGSSDAEALRAILAVAHNQPELALQKGRAAVQTDLQSAAAFLALSYAQQANLQLHAAQESARQATLVEPDNALAWARFAEMNWLLGDLSGAAQANAHALHLNPRLPKAQVTAGFIYLLQIQYQQAEVAFNTALQLDPADPEPRLGLGLLRIRQGHLAEGRQQLEYAASQDPTRSILRTYVGKAYFEEKRDSLAQTQFGMAREFDRNDPSPYFYEGIRQLYANQPVQALESLETSQDLNNQRAIYRADPLLQSDAATRSAAVARVYTELGFDQQVLTEGWDALRQDRTNHDGHRLLADRYAALPRHDAARVSELLQSQLWQPLSAAALPPQSAESGLAILDTLGPSRPGFNEYHDLFTGDGFHLTANAMAGGNDTNGEDLVLSWLAGPMSASAGAYKYRTDGYWKNTDQDQTIYSGFAQFQMGPDTQLQFELRQLDWERGDVGLKFFNDRSSSLRVQQNVDTGRVGLRHSWSPTNHTLVSVIRQDFEETNRSAPNAVQKLAVESTEKPLSMELQQAFDWGSTSWVAGVGRYRADRNDKATLTTPLPFPPFPVVDVALTNDSFTIRHDNGYLYSTLNAADSFSVLLGVSYDRFESQQIDVSNWNPKLGLWWKPIDSLSLRAAAFRMTKRSLASKQTIEPTEIFGFNQLYDDLNGSDAWNYGVGADLRLAQNMTAGVGYHVRDLDVPYQLENTLTNVTDVLETKWSDSVLNVYYDYAPLDWLAISLQYLHENYEFSDDLLATSSSIRSLETQQVPLTLSFFSSLGLTLRVTGRYVHQDVQKFVFAFDPTNPSPAPVDKPTGRDEFWLMDTTLAYKLPRRYGEVSVGVANVADHHFHYQELDPLNAELYPERFVYGRLSLAF